MQPADWSFFAEQPIRNNYDLCLMALLPYGQELSRIKIMTNKNFNI